MSKILKFKCLENPQHIKKLAEELKEGRRLNRQHLACELKDARNKLKQLKLEIGLVHDLHSARKELNQLKWELSQLMTTIRRAKDIAQERIDTALKKSRKTHGGWIRSARARLKALKMAHTMISESLIAPVTPLPGDFGFLYPAPPPPILNPSREGLGLPSYSGVYFLWKGQVIEYIGQASRLDRRLQLRAHHVLEDDHKISFILLERKELCWAESFYIGALRPSKNFGKLAISNKGSRSDPWILKKQRSPN